MNCNLFSIKCSQLFGPIFFALALSACGGDETSASGTDSTSTGSDKKIREFASSDKPVCNAKREGMVIRLTDDDEYYLCEDGFWEWMDEPEAMNANQDDDEGLSDGTSESSSDDSAKKRSSSSAKGSLTGDDSNLSAGTSSSSQKKLSDEDIPGRVLYGYAQARPFGSGAKVRVNPLTKDLRPREDIDYYYGKTESCGYPNDSCGFYKVAGIPEDIDYAEIRVTGECYNGAFATIKDTVYAIVNLQTVDSVNVTPLTAAISQRIKYLVRNNGMEFAEAKKQAESDLLKAFSADREFYNFEKIDFYSVDTSNGLWPYALASLVTGDSPFRLEKSVDFSERGELPVGDSIMKYLFDRGMGCWTIPISLTDIESLGFCDGMLSLQKQFFDVYTGRGECTDDRDSVVVRADPIGIFDYYSCHKGFGWQVASRYEYDTFPFDHPCTEVGLKKGSVSSNSYFCTPQGNWIDGTNWDWRVPKEYRLNPNIEYGEMIDERDNQVYKTVEINGKTWMAQNLNFHEYTTGVAEDDSLVHNLKNASRCYGDSSVYCDVCGRLYHWQAVMNIDFSLDSATKLSLFKTQHQGVCPNGWHIPSEEEWMALDPQSSDFNKENNLTALSYAATGWNYDYRDSLGLSILPCGMLHNRNGKLEKFEMGSSANFFFANRNVKIKYIKMYESKAVVDKATRYEENDYYSVRCVMDD